MVHERSRGPWRLERQRHGAGARVRRLQMDAEYLDDARLSRHVRLRNAGHRVQLPSRQFEELPLPAVDVRAFRRFQVHLLAELTKFSHHASNARVTRFTNAERWAAVEKFMS